MSRFRAAILAVLPLVLATAASAQIVASERGAVRQTIDGTVVEIDYSRPSARGRGDLFGGVVEWGLVWTPGANAATTISFSRPVELEGVAVEPGAYSVWIEVREGEPWRLGLHADTSMFHTDHPPLTEAAYVVEATPEEGPEFVETLRFSLPDVRSDGATIRLDWGRTRLDLDLAVESTIDLTVPPAEGRGLAGRWEFGPPGEDGMPLRLRYDESTRRVVGDWTQGGTDVPVTLVRRAEGIYQIGLFIGDRVGTVIDVWYFEFFDFDDGRPNAFEVRDGNDEIRFEGRRLDR